MGLFLKFTMFVFGGLCLLFSFLLIISIMTNAIKYKEKYIKNDMMFSVKLALLILITACLWFAIGIFIC